MGITMKPVVVFMINSLAGGGAERVITQLLAHSHERSARYDIHLVLLETVPDAYPLPQWVHVHRLDTGGGLSTSILRVVNLFRKLRPALCLSFLTRANIVNVAAARICGHRALISERVSPSSHHPQNLPGRASRLATRLVYPYAGGVICPSQGVATDLIANFAVNPSRIHVIHNPLDVDAILQAAGEPVASPRPYLVAVGRPVDNKNFSMLINAFAAADTGDDLVILGEGPLRASLESQTRKLGLAERIRMPGFLANPYPVMRNAHAFVLSSNAEGFPNALAEAMALGVPVIATNCRSGPSEILDGLADQHIRDVHHARHGMLVPVDDPFAMARAISEMSDPLTRTLYARKSRRRAADFGIEVSVNAYWWFLEATIKTPR
jgi:glycosyltransferase involved in cell wall biosynthesis